MKYTAIETDIVRKWQKGYPDANGQTPEQATSDGAGNSCRHCLKDIPKGAPMLILAHRPFDSLQPYAETGPIFVCANPCARDNGETLPPILQSSPDYLVKGYAANDRIIYGTGAIIAAQNIADHCASMLEDQQIAYLHVRSARNNCYQLRIER